MSVFLEEITLRNVLSYGAETCLPLRSLNVLIGPNGSGKSNLIEAVSLLRSAHSHLGSEVRDGGGIRDWLWKGETRPQAKLEAVVANRLGLYQGEKSLRHAIEFQEANLRFEIVDERIEDCEPDQGHPSPRFYYRHLNGRPMLNVRNERSPRQLKREDVDLEKSILAQRRDPDQYPEITYLGEQYSRIRVYREWSFGRYTPPRQPQRPDLRNDFLEPDGANLGLVLNKFRRDPPLKQRVIELLQELYPLITDFDVDINGGFVQVFLTEGRFSIPATRLSDGTLRYLCLLAILCQPDPPPLVCIEEPELGLHPDVMSSFGGLLKEASERMQLIVTTHSDELIDGLSDTPEDVVICEKHDGQTQLARLDGDSLKEWLEDYHLGELWRRGELGGNRW